jgi:hypothetical protein
MSDPYAIGFKELYEKLCQLEVRIDTQVAIELARQDERLRTLERGSDKRWALGIAVVSACVAIVVLVIQILAK